MSLSFFFSPWPPPRPFDRRHQEFFMFEGVSNFRDSFDLQFLKGWPTRGCQARRPTHGENRNEGIPKFLDPLKHEKFLGRRRSTAVADGGGLFFLQWPGRHSTAAAVDRRAQGIFHIRGGLKFFDSFGRHFLKGAALFPPCPKNFL